MTKTTQAAIRKYGEEVCRRAFELSKQGEGPSTIALYTGLRFNSANAAINAGRQIAHRDELAALDNSDNEADARARAFGERF